VVDTRLTYLLTLFPKLPSLGETPPLTMANALVLLRQQGGTDLELLAELLEAESLLREALDEWIVNPTGSRVVPSSLPPPLRALFNEGRMLDLTEETWVGSVRQAYLDLLSESAHRVGGTLLARWSRWEGSMRLNLARHRARLRGDRDEHAEGPPAVDPWLEAALTAWSATRSRGGEAERLGAAMEAEIALDAARLSFLERESPRYSFAMDELVAYLLHLRLLERHQQLDQQRGRTLLKEVGAL